MPHAPTTPPRLSAREFLVALVVSLALAAWPLRQALFSSGHVLFGVDTATCQLPWSAAIDAGGEPRPRNPGISDQGHVFYPYYLWVAQSWLAGDPPAWNPWLYAGVPGIANPQSGALDPQVLPLVLLYKLGGRAAFDRGFAWLAWLRLAAAGLGAYLLARALGLGRYGAAAAGIVFGLSGYVLLWLNFSLGHVTPLLPWVLLAIQGMRGKRPWAAVVGASLALALAILGGHPETAFYVGATAGVFALALAAEERRAGLLALLSLALGTALAAVSLLPFLEYLDLSGAKAIRDAAFAPGGVDLVALGTVLVALGLCAWFLRILAEEQRERPGGLGRDGIVGAVGIALALGGLLSMLVRRGGLEEARLLLWPSLFGAPGAEGGYAGGGTYTEAASGWIAAAGLCLALAAALAPRGALRHRRIVTGMGLVALVLVLEMPGALDLYRYMPLVGLGATTRFAAVSALMLALLAGEALEAAPRASRLAAGLLLSLLAGLALRQAPAEGPLPESLATVQEDELFGLLQRPAAELKPEGLVLEGWLHPGVAIERGMLTVQRLDARGQPLPTCFSTELDFFDEPSPRARAEAAPELARVPAGARFFRPTHMPFGALEEGLWRFAVDFYAEAADERPSATRIVAVARVTRPLHVALGARTLVLLGLLACAFLGAHPRPLAKSALLALLYVQGLAFARGLNPAIPAGECFPATRTEEILGEILGPQRFLGDVNVLPPDTGMVSELRALDGYDGLDVAEFNAYRALCLPPGANGLLAWHARGVLLESPALRLFGVGALVCAAPLEAQGFDLVASPLGEPRAETWIYRARDPFPRAFVAAHVVGYEELRELFASGTWDPRTTASTDDAWRPGRPFQSASVSTPRWTNNEVALEAELDGDGLLVLTDQAFPGWKAYVDGERAPLVTANAIFRGVPLGPGKHQVLFRYAPWTLRVGAWISAAALAVVLGLLAWGLWPRAAPSAPR